MSNEFSVCQFFENDQYEYVRRYVSAAEAAEAFRDYSNNPAAKIGITKRVIITDGGDCIVAEWKLGEGLVWPKYVCKNCGVEIYLVKAGEHSKWLTNVKDRNTWKCGYDPEFPVRTHDPVALDREPEA